MSDSKRSFWLRPNGLAAMDLVLAVLYFLLTEHRARREEQMVFEEFGDRYCDDMAKTPAFIPSRKIKRTAGGLT